MRHVDLAITAAFVIPVEPAGVLHGHTVLVDAGRIVALAPPEAAGRDFLPRTRIELPRHALLPGPQDDGLAQLVEAVLAAATVTER